MRDDPSATVRLCSRHVVRLSPASLLDNERFTSKCAWTAQNAIRRHSLLLQLLGLVQMQNADDSHSCASSFTLWRLCRQRVQTLERVQSTIRSKLEDFKAELSAVQAAKAASCDEAANELRDTVAAQLMSAISDLERQEQHQADCLSFYEKMVAPEDTSTDGSASGSDGASVVGIAGPGQECEGNSDDVD
jgi:hypothetical protein